MTRNHSTVAVHGGEIRPKPYGAITSPIVQSSTYTFKNTGEIIEFMESKERGDPIVRDEYGRYSNPTQSVVERKLTALEHGEDAVLFSSGMNAITTALSSLLSSGDHLILIEGCYHRTREFASTFLSRWGVDVSIVAIDDFDALESAIQSNTKLVFAETPTNPYLRVIDLNRLVELAQKYGFLTFLDSTFATPINLRPLELGVDLVVHSASKYLGGHNDLLGGVVIGARTLMDDIRYARGILGGVSSPNDAYLLLRGLKTLELRVRQQNKAGLRVATYLDQHAKISRVFYPQLESHPDHAIAARQMAGFGSVVSFEIEGDFDATGRFIDCLQIPYIGPTLGGVESIIEQPAALFSMDPEDRRKAGLSDNLVRYAIGIEDPDDIIADLSQALEAV